VAVVRAACLLQLGCSVLVVVLVRFKVNGNPDGSSSSNEDVCLLAPPSVFAEACTYGGWDH
jgi:hypothetical protein